MHKIALMNVLFGLLTTLCFIFPDLVLGHSLHLISARISFGVVLSCIFGMIWLGGLKSRGYWIAFLWGAQGILIGHWIYFGLPLHSHDIPKLWHEMFEIFETGRSVSATLYLPFVSTLLISGAGLFYSTKIPFKKYPLAFLPLLIMPCYFLYRGPKMFHLQTHSPSISATVRAFSNFIAHGWRTQNNPPLKPYRVHYAKPSIPHIVLIMGESMNPDYSYSMQDTPFLYGLKPFFCIGTSLHVTTRESLDAFFNVIQENSHTSLPTHQNLFRLAKRQGYRTTFLSSQNADLLARCGHSFIDKFVTAETMHIDSPLQRDEKLLTYVKHTSWHKQHFLVLHLRHAHSPYESFFQGHVYGKDRRTQTINAYRKVMRYHDDWLKRLFQLLPKDAQVIFVSDHGEMMGEEDLYGHNFEHPSVHRIPIWSYPARSLPKTHYEVGALIAKWMGARIENHNAQHPID